MPRCINCSFFISGNWRRRRLDETSEDLINTLFAWTNAQMTPDDVLCWECLEILEQASPHDERRYGHQELCYGCGTSILRAKRHKVPLNCPERDVILKWGPTHLIHRLSCVCLACWRRATRQIVRNNARNIDDEKPELAEPAIPVPPPLPLPVQEPVIPVPPPAPPLPLPVQAPRIINQQLQSITLPNYKRATATSRHCIFNGCTKPERLLVPMVLKERLLIDYNFYVPLSARICNHHLNGFFWNELDSPIHTFTALQLENMMFILSSGNQREVDFENINNMRPHLCQYWLGVSAEEFNQLLLQTPNLNQQVRCPSLALSILLVKLRTGDSNIRLSSLFKLPRSTLERYMKTARDCLHEHSMPL